MTPSDAIPSDDRGFTLGDGLFETLLVDGGPPQFWDEHLARLTAGCATLGLPAPEPAALAAAAEAALAGQFGRLALRLTVTAGSGGRGLDRPPAPALHIVATAAAAPRPQGPTTLALSTVRRNEGSPTSRLKTLAYLDNVLARAEARAAGADEAVMLNSRGELACAAAANLFWLEAGTLRTPALTCGVLGGIVRARVLAAAARLGVEVSEARVGPEALAAAEAVFVTNSLIGVRAVAALGAQRWAPHALVERLADAIV